jgi:hypothetical protein
MSFGHVLLSIGAVVLLVTGIQGLRRGELQLRRQWGDIGGPKELPPIRGRAGVIWSVWLFAAGAGLLVWIWRA